MSQEAAKDYIDVKTRLSALKKSASPIERHCAMGLCRRGGSDPEKLIRGFPLWLHFLPTVRNVLTVRELAVEFEANGR